MVVISAGQFMMGSPAGIGDSNEHPQRRVTIAQPFAVGLAPVTRAEFAAFVAATGHKAEGGAYIWDGNQVKLDKTNSWRGPAFQQGDDHPVVCVNWHDAEAYVAWLRKATGNKPYRLLSETEWEYCCRAGTSTAYSTGEKIEQHQANFAMNEKGTTPFSKYPANAWGLRDMHGNVWEWCADNWQPDDTGNPPNDGSVWLGGDATFRVVRGGSWYFYPHDPRSARRGQFRPDYRGNDIGFRVARTLFP
jgi:formylglycine-generating enzyme required for sulfatase activity